MIQKLLNKTKVIHQISFMVLFVVMNVTATYGQTPVPTGNATQYFCSSASWLNAGFTDPGDTFEELYLYGENLIFYPDDGTGNPDTANPIANPSTKICMPTIFL